MSPHHFRITNRNDGSSFSHGPVYDHTPEAALALVRLTFGAALWDVCLSQSSVCEIAQIADSRKSPIHLNQLDLF